MRILFVLTPLLLSFGLACETPPPRSIEKEVANATPTQLPVSIPSREDSLSSPLQEVKDWMPKDVKEVLINAESLEVFSVNFIGMEFHPSLLDSVPALKRKMEKPDEKRFYGCEVLGSTEISDAHTKSKILNALFAGASSISPGDSMMCFYPRHGIRANHKGRMVRLLISFECQNFYAYTANGQTGGYVRSNAQEVFDSVLKAAAVPLTNEVLKDRFASAASSSNRLPQMLQ